MKQLRKWVLDRWKLLLAALIMAAITGFLLFFRIGVLTHGVSAPEQHYIQSIRSGKQILYEPVFGIHKVPVYVLFKLHIHRVGAYRAISAVFAAVMVLSGFFVLKRWYSLRIAILGTWLLLCSALTLHVGRLATPEASFLLLMPLIAATVWMYTAKNHSLAIVVLSALTGFSLYIPGFFWLFAAVWIWQRKDLWQAIKHMGWVLRILCVLIVLVSAAPLLFASVHSHQNLLVAAGLPLRLPSLAHIGKNILQLPLQLFVRGPKDPVHWLGRLPFLDVFSTVMVILGLYSLRYHVSHVRTQLLLGIAAILSLFIIAGGLPIIPLLPIIYILVAAGVAFMLQQWFTVFPRNPIARGIATSLMSITILLVSFYNLNHYFIAWPHTPATRQVFNQKL